jgi:hypothetical protein
MPLSIRASFMQPLVSAAASAVLLERLQPLLQGLHAAGGLQSGDVIVCADMYFRVEQRIWHGGQDELALEIVLQHQSWHCKTAGGAARG